MTPLERAQKVAFWVAVVCLTLGFLTSAGCRMLPTLPAGSVWVLHPLLLVLGAISGFLASRRNEEIDRQRWQVAEDPSLTSGERDYAHRYAERQRRWASTSFIAAPLMIGYWLAYQTEGAGRLLTAQLLPATSLLGAVIGFLLARLPAPRQDRGGGGSGSVFGR